MNDPITIRVFRATDEPETCEKFYQGHIDVLHSYGVEPISSAKKEWFTNAGVYGLIAEQQGKIVGGVKLHKADGITALPVEESIGYIDKRIYDLVKGFTKKGVGEACGLWNSKDVAGMGVSYILSRAVVTIAHQFGVNRLFALSSDHTIKMFRELGFRVIRKIGEKGDFIYPTPQYISRVLLVNSETLSTASAYNKMIMFSLRQNPDQNRHENGPKGEMEVKYQMHLPVR